MQANDQRGTMRDRIIIIIAVIFCVFIMLTSDLGNPRTKIYDCTISEISPDFPIEVKEECRRLRKEYHEKNNSRYTT